MIPSSLFYMGSKQTVRFGMHGGSRQQLTRSSSPASQALEARISVLGADQAVAQADYNRARREYIRAGGDKARGKNRDYDVKVLKPLRQAWEDVNTRLQDIRTRKREAQTALNQRRFHKVETTDSQNFPLPTTPPPSIANAPDRDFFHSEKQHFQEQSKQHNNSEFAQQWKNYLWTLYHEMTEPN